MKSVHISNYLFLLIAGFALLSCGDDESVENLAPLFEDQSFDVSETIGESFIIGNLTARDPEGGSLNFELLNDDSGLFEITSAGQLSLALGKSLNFALNSQHIIMASVSDGVNEASASIIINIRENSVPEIMNQNFTVDENIDSNEIIGQVVATDQDNEALSFSIVGDQNEPIFEITNSGTITLSSGSILDYESEDEHSFEVEVADARSSSKALITVFVNDLPDRPFITTWKISVVNDEITIPIGTGEYNYSVEWGDGNTDQNITSSAAHVYENIGTYTIKISGDFPRIFFDFTSDDEDKIITIEQWGDIQWESFQAAFAGCSFLVSNAIDIPNLASVENLSRAFANAEMFNGDLSQWDVSNVVNFNGLFEGTSFNHSISGWDVSQATTMARMFANNQVFNQDLNSWNVGRVTDMNSMFTGATSFNGNISGWDVSNVQDMSSLLNRAESFQQDLSNWNVSNVINMDNMFSLSPLFNSDLTNWDVSKVINIAAMFSGATSFNSDISQWNVSAVVEMRGVFANANSFDQDIGAWDISSVTTMAFMLDNSGLSIQNYENTLLGWSNLATLPSDIELGSDGLEYCDQGETSRDFLTSKGWNITGDTKASAGDCN